VVELAAQLTCDAHRTAWGAGPQSVYSCRAAVTAALQQAMHHSDALPAPATSTLLQRPPDHGTPCRAGLVKAARATCAPAAPAAPAAHLPHLLPTSPARPTAPPAPLTPPPPLLPATHRQQAREEGELIRAKALQEAADQAAKEAATRTRLQQANLDTRRANEVLQGFKAREKEAEAQLEREIEGGWGCGCGASSYVQTIEGVAVRSSSEQKQCARAGARSAACSARHVVQDVW
jgi:hypothetical protein